MKQIRNKKIRAKSKKAISDVIRKKKVVTALHSKGYYYLYDLEGMEYSIFYDMFDQILFFMLIDALENEDMYWETEEYGDAVLWEGSEEEYLALAEVTDDTPAGEYPDQEYPQNEEQSSYVEEEPVEDTADEDSIRGFDGVEDSSSDYSDSFSGGDDGGSDFD